MVGIAHTQASAPKLTETVVPVLRTDTGVIVTPAFGSEKLWPTISTGLDQEVVAGVMSSRYLLFPSEVDPVCITTPLRTLLLVERKLSVTVQVAHVMLRSGGLLQPQGDTGGVMVQAAPCTRPGMRQSDRQGHGAAAA